MTCQITSVKANHRNGSMIILNIKHCYVKQTMPMGLNRIMRLKGNCLGIVNYEKIASVGVVLSPQRWECSFPVGFICSCVVYRVYMLVLI